MEFILYYQRAGIRLKILHKEQYQDIIHRCYPETTNQKIQTADITFQITDDCNLQCSYCYQINKGHHVMNLEIAKKFIDLILQPDENAKLYLNSQDSTAVVLDFIGGEPLLQIELIDNIITYFIYKCIELNHPWQYHHMISISSNGTLYFNPKVQQFIKKWNNILSFGISIDGNKKLHDSCRIFPDGKGSYDIAMKAVKAYNKFHKESPMATKMTISPNNIIYLKEAIINLINEGYNDIFCNYVFEKGWTLEHAKILYLELKSLADYILNNNIQDIYIALFEEGFFKPKDITDDQNWCGGNGHMIAVDWKGDIYPCLRYMESSLGNSVPPIIIGNTSIGLLNSSNHKNNAKLVQSVNRLTQSTKTCIECPIAEGCAWCQAYNYQDSKGNINHRATYICDLHKARSLANVYFWNLYYIKNNINKSFKMYLPKNDALNIINEEEYNMLKILYATTLTKYAENN